MDMDSENGCIKKQGGFYMLGHCTTQKEYLHFALSELQGLAQTRPEQIREYKKAIIKMLILNLDPIIPIIAPLYSKVGSPAKMQVETFRSLVLMKHLGIPLNSWVEKLTNNPVLRVIAGFTLENMPKTTSYYDFMDRVVPMDEKPAMKTFTSKPRKKLKKGEKLPPKNPGIVGKLVEKVITDEERFMGHLARRPERYLQKIFARVAVDASVNMGLIDESVPASGDGTCLETGASSYGVKVCSCIKKGIYKCNCDRKFSDPNATWGWDSHNERYYYGYTGYFISTYSEPFKTDLPLYLRLVSASRHDSVSAIFALAEFRELYPNLHINTFISDSASDNYPTYKLLDHWNMNAVIALNNRNTGNTKYPSPLRIDKDGVPICPAGYPMTKGGPCPGRRRIKWCCPRKGFTINPFPACASCSKSPYGRVFYTKFDWDLRLFTRIVRGSLSWKHLMNKRTASERVNDRILQDYGVEDGHSRGKKRISFDVTLAAINVHLDAQFKVLSLSNFFHSDHLLFLPFAA